MEFGKLASIEHLDFSLPADSAFNRQVLSGHPAGSGLAIYLGATGWSMKEWVGSYYPKGTKAKDFLAAYGRQFNTIELNTTHYRIPDIETITRWQAETPADFRFCPKIPQVISHSRDLGLQGTALPQFWEVISGLGNKLGPCFLQLPPYFSTDQQAMLERWLKRWPRTLPLAVELRHESWFATSAATESWLAMLQRYGVGTVITDVAGRRDVLHMGLSAPFVLVRMVGNGLHPTDYQRASDWVARLLQWTSEGLEEVFFFPHQPDNIQAPLMATYFFEQCKEAGFTQCRGPQLLANAPDADGQLGLFG
ncbi:MAG: DUF72 domain-containing protein [Lewinellaceae bacterium]|nr:DUF72 domain-containing protein [Lewinellaceae bacterium]